MRKSHIGDDGDKCRKAMSWEVKPPDLAGIDDKIIEEITLWRIRHWCNLCRWEKERNRTIFKVKKEICRWAKRAKKETDTIFKL